MVDPKANKRFVVSNFGFAWAVQDTGERVEYKRRGKNENTELSNNPRNARMVDVFPTRAQAQDRADELNVQETAKS